MSTELEEARQRRVHQHLEAENAHDLRLMGIDFTEYGACDDRAWLEHSEGAEAIRAHFRELWLAAPDLRIEVVKTETSGDAVMMDCVMRGTHLGPWHGLAPTGAKFSVPVRESLEFHPGSEFLASETIVYDRRKLLEQLGAGEMTH